MIPKILYDIIWFLGYYIVSYDIIWFMGYYMIHRILYDSRIRYDSHNTIWFLRYYIVSYDS